MPAIQTISPSRTLNESLEQLEEIRLAGYAVSYNEHEQNLTSIATPIFDAEHQVKAALFISGPSYRLGREKVSEIAKRMKDVAMEISVLLGY